MTTLTLIEPFEVSQGQEALFRKDWQDAVEPLRHIAGFLSILLYEVDDETEERLVDELGFHWLKQRPASSARFRFITLTEWASLAHYETAMRSPHQERARAFFFHPAFYRLYNRFDNPTERLRPKEASAKQTFTLIVPFEVPKGQEGLFLKEWQEIVESAGEVEGSFGPGLYERDREAEERLSGLLAPGLQENSEARFRFVNVATWASVAQYAATIRARHHIKPISFPGYGAYYRIVAQWNGE